MPHPTLRLVFILLVFFGLFLLWGAEIRVDTGLWTGLFPIHYRKIGVFGYVTQAEPDPYGPIFSYGPYEPPGPKIDPSGLAITILATLPLLAVAVWLVREAVRRGRNEIPSRETK